MTIRDLVRNSLRMRPDRIVVGECRGGEALDMLQAMNTGHDGSLTTIHANTPRDAIARLETMVLMAGIEFPLKVVRQHISSAVDVIVQQSRLKDGSRRITNLTEVTGMEGDVVVMNEVFRFEQTGAATDSKVTGQLRPTGVRPLFSPRLEMYGFKLPGELFGGGFSDPPRRRRSCDRAQPRCASRKMPNLLEQFLAWSPLDRGGPSNEIRSGAEQNGHLAVARRSRLKSRLDSPAPSASIAQRRRGHREPSDPCGAKTVGFGATLVVGLAATDQCGEGKSGLRRGFLRHVDRPESTRNSAQAPSGVSAK